MGMREEFEAIYPRPHRVNWSERLQAYGANDMTFTCVQVFIARWEAWQASREAVVVELPAGGYFLGYDNEHMMESRDVRDAIEAQGLKVKP